MGWHPLAPGMEMAETGLRLAIFAQSNLAARDFPVKWNAGKAGAFVVMKGQEGLASP